MSACPSDASLEQYFRGGASTIDALAIGRHLASCSACGERHLLESRPTASLPGPAAPAVGRHAFRGTARYDVTRRIGSGAMGAVYEVFDRQRGEPVALKTMLDVHAASILELKREFRSLVDVVHPNLVTLYEMERAADEWFFTMELVRGHDLRDEIPASPLDATSAPARFASVRSCFAQLARGLHALHVAGKLHRDVKPSNVMVERGGRVVLVDFGLVAEIARRPDAQGVAHSGQGTVVYMSPEQQLLEALTPASDWFSFGMVLYEALTGRLAFGDRLPALLLARLTSRPPRARAVLPSVPGDLDDLCARLLERDAARRPTADEVLDVLGPRSAGELHALPRSALTVGREEPLARLREAYAAARGGRTVVVEIHASSGIGKTHLVRTFIEELRGADGPVVLDGRCYEHESVPYKALDALVDQLSEHLRGLSAPDRAKLVPPDAALLGEAFPVLRRVVAIPPRDPSEPLPDMQERRRRALVAFRQLLDQLARRAPLVLFIDDLQWGDVDSATFLDELVRAGPPLLLILCYRTGDVDPSFLPCRRALDPSADGLAAGRDGDAAAPRALELELQLEPLALDAATTLARSLLARSGPCAAAAIAGEAQGNPLLLHELVRHALGGGDIAEGGGVATSAVRLDDMLRRRTAQLATDERSLLETLAIAGRPVDERLALRASSVTTGQLRVVGALASARLLVTRRCGPASTLLEPFHDRIREVVVGALDDAARCGRHLALALAMEAEPEPDAQALVEHFRAGGQPRRAGRYAVAAAEVAARALAFERAAALYATAVELDPDQGPPAWALVERRAEVLTSAGRSGDAAEAFLDAAARLSEIDPSHGGLLRMRRRAAEQLLRCGRNDEGMAVMRSVLAAVGVRAPESARAAMASALVKRARFLVGGYEASLRRERVASAADGARLDALWAASTSLSMMNFAIADALGVRHLLEALRVGEPSRVARALGFEASFEASLGGRVFRARSRRMLARVAELAEETGDPYDLAWSQIAAGTSAWLGAEWAASVDACDRAAALLRQHCTGVSWELAITDLYALSALALLGRIDALTRRLPDSLREAEQRGDRFAANNCRLGQHSVLWLALDEVDECRRLAAEAERSWPAGSFHTQRYAHLIATVQADLYAGDGAGAWARIAGAWDRLVEGQFLRLEVPRVELLQLRARAALAAAAELRPGEALRDAAHPARRWPRSALVGVARADARRIGRVRVPIAAPFSSLLRAGVHRMEADVDSARAALRDAVDGFDAAGMALYREAGSFTLAELEGGAGAGARREASRAWMAALGVRRPERLVGALAPGCAAAASASGG